MDKKFSQPPTLKEQKINAFIDEPKINNRVEKQSMKSVTIRFPESIYNDLKLIACLTHLSFNDVCLEILRPGAKKKIKELEAE